MGSRKRKGVMLLRAAKQYSKVALLREMDAMEVAIERRDLNPYISSSLIMFLVVLANI